MLVPLCVELVIDTALNASMAVQAFQHMALDPGNETVLKAQAGYELFLPPQCQVCNCLNDSCCWHVSTKLTL